MFIPLADDRIINADHVVSIVELDSPHDLHQFEMTDGDIIYARPLGDPSSAFAQIIPANPGFEGVRLRRAGTPDEFLERHPVIAWRLDAFGGTAPVTPAGDADTHFAVLYPDGHVVSHGEEIHDSLDSWVVHEQSITIRVERLVVGRAA